MKLKTFVVEGSGRFPIDMLRYVPCWPATEHDSHLASLPNGLRRVTVETMSGSDAAAARWESFVWKVIA